MRKHLSQNYIHYQILNGLNEYLLLMHEKWLFDNKIALLQVNQGLQDATKGHVSKLEQNRAGKSLQGTLYR